LGGTLWRYVLQVTPERVLHEAVYRRPSKPRAKFSHVFVRSWDAAAKEYLIKQDGFGLDPAEARKVRANASLISTAAQYGVKVAQHLVGANVASNIMHVGRIDPNMDLINAALFFFKNSVLKQRMEALLRDLDFGLSGVEIRELDLTLPSEVKIPENMKALLQY
ncbi:hypothetical protein ACQV5M_21300, partial [Leptospira sp. SA-E8]|uniref:hypothetical protein n=1 Tax=Leptospira sp. SA-E8 TaxID=3422259 RepID=UPI003EB7BB73